MKHGALGVGALLLVLSGCGDDEANPYEVPERFEAYCAEVEKQQTAIGQALEGGAETGLIDALPSFHSLAEQAPDDIAPDWKTVITRAEGLVDALEAADVDPSTYDRASPPEGLSPEELRAIDGAATALVSPATRAAMMDVQQHARDVCKTPLSL